MSIETLLKDYNIPTSTGGKNWQRGWIQVQCCFCNDNSDHLGINLTNGYANCWKCGGHQIEDVISKLLGVKWFEAKELLKQYQAIDNQAEVVKKRPLAKICILPGNDLQTMHCKYLSDRNFNYNSIHIRWGIRGTGPIGAYKLRIIIPIFFDGKLVSYQGRDITGRSSLRYKACPIEKEVIHHKHIVYGIDHVKNRKAVIVEGVFDVWRLGYGSVSTFGTEVTNEQVLLLADRLDQAYVMFDDEDAEGKAESLANRLVALGVSVDIIELTGEAEDPAELSDLEAAKIMKLIK